MDQRQNSGRGDGHDAAGGSACQHSGQGAFTKDAEVKGTTVAMDVPMRFSETPCQFGPTHRIGEDNDYVYGVVLGMSKEEIDRLTEEGVLV